MISIFQYPARERKEKEKQVRPSMAHFNLPQYARQMQKKDFVSGGLELKWKRNFLVKNEKVKKKNSENHSKCTEPNIRYGQ